jgi:hypothetical protein
MSHSSDRIDIHDRKHRFELALRNLEQDPKVTLENKMLIQRFVTFCRAANLSLERQLIYLQKLTVLARLHAPFEQATRDSIVSLMADYRLVLDSHNWDSLTGRLLPRIRS